MTDLVERLRERANDKFIRDYPLMAEAADEIERLTEEAKWMEAAMKRVADEEKKTDAEIERLREELRSEREGKISQSYAAELARQVGELEAENEQLRARFVPEIDAASE